MTIMEIIHTVSEITTVPTMVLLVWTVLSQRRAIKRLRDLLDSHVDSDPCDLDHNGNCQAHGWFAYGESECNQARTKRYLSSKETSHGNDA